MKEDDDREMDNELEFLKAMNAYRKAKEAGDEQALRNAEDAWREQVRSELKNSRH